MLIFAGNHKVRLQSLRAFYHKIQVKEIIYVTRKTHALDRYAEAFSDMLVSVLHGTDLRTAVEECNQNLSGSNSLGGMLFRYWWPVVLLVVHSWLTSQYSLPSFFFNLKTYSRSTSIRDNVERSRGDPMVACYIDSSFPTLLHFAYKYADSPEKAILANANAGNIEMHSKQPLLSHIIFIIQNISFNH